MQAVPRAGAALRGENGEDYMTEVLPFEGFRLNREDFLSYYRTRPDAPFCQTYIHPKLRTLRQRHGAHLKPDVVGKERDTDRIIRP